MKRYLTKGLLLETGHKKCESTRNIKKFLPRSQARSLTKSKKAEGISGAQQKCCMHQAWWSSQ
jgi:hypothetical protein